MTLTNALFSSVSGLAASSTAISVIGDNIANANTPGFKEKRAEFAAVLGQNITVGSGFAQVGAGARTNDIGTIFSQGTFEQTGRATDLGIEGRGFFVLEGDSGRTYSRAGIFGFDSNGFLVDPGQSRVQGFGVDPVTGQPNGALGDIQVNLPLSPPQATSSIELAMNLSSDETAIPGGFDPTDPFASSQAQETVPIFDSLGTRREATIFFTKTAADTWQYNVTLPDAQSGAPTGDPFVVQGTGDLVFDSSGQLLSIAGGTAPPTVTLNLDASNGAQPLQDITFSMGPIGAGAAGDPTTSFATETATNAQLQDGFAPGQLASLEIDENGRLNGVFTNGNTQSLAQIGLANFGNVEGLTEIGGSQLAESISSGPPIIAAANTGNLGSIRSSSLEKSNVDLAQQFVNLIVSQRSFQANTRTVSVANELLANLVNLGQ